MNTIKPRPYLLKNIIQNYAWGETGKNAFIPELTGIKPEKNTPYAELWLGAHDNAPSSLVSEGKTFPLNQLIPEYTDMIVGKTRPSGNSFPFLLKILTAGTPLSIQAHPNKIQAGILRKKKPEHYPDDNHKPEIAIALGRFTALAGFKERRAFIDTLYRYPDIMDFIGKKKVEKIIRDGDPDLIKHIYKSYLECLDAKPETLSLHVCSLEKKLRGKKSDLLPEENYFLKLLRHYGTDDPGLFTLFLLNFLVLNRGEAIYLEAGIPHAYLEGNIIECMANSDNVVRLGLTPKFKDIEALSEIIDYTGRQPEIMGKGHSSSGYCYQTPSEEFLLSRIILKKSQIQEFMKHDGPEILIVLKGNVTLSWDSGSLLLNKGDSILNPAILRHYTLLAASDTEIYKAEVPE